METPQFDQVLLMNWLMTTLEPISDADPIVLAKYVIALLQKDKPEKYLRQNCLKQLDIFLGKETSSFVDLLFRVIKDKSYEHSPVAKCLRTKKELNDARDVSAGPMGDANTNVNSARANQLEKKEDNKIKINIKSSSEAEIISNTQTDQPAHSESAPSWSFFRTHEERKNKLGSKKQAKSLGRKLAKSKHGKRKRFTRSPSSNSPCSTCNHDQRSHHDPRRSRSHSHSHCDSSDNDSASNDGSKETRVSTSVSTTQLQLREKDKSHTGKSSPSDQFLKLSQRNLSKYKLTPMNPGITVQDHHYQHTVNPHNDVDLRHDLHRFQSTTEHINSTLPPMAGGELSIEKPNNFERNASEKADSLTAELCKDSDKLQTVSASNQCLEINEPNLSSQGLSSRIQSNKVIDHPLQLMNMEDQSMHLVQPFNLLSPFYVKPLNSEAEIMDPSIWINLMGTNAAGSESFVGMQPNPYQGPRLWCPPSNSCYNSANKRRDNEANWQAGESNTRYNSSNNATIVLDDQQQCSTESKPTQTGKERSKSNTERTVLVIRNIPPRFNTIGSLNKHFSRFGTVVYIQVCFDSNPESALVQFSNSIEATAAIRSTEAVFNNRFIKVYWAKAHQAAQSGLQSVSVSDESAIASTTTNHKRAFAENSYNQRKQQHRFRFSNEHHPSPDSKELEDEAQPSKAKQERTESIEEAVIKSHGSKPTQVVGPPAQPIRAIPIAQKIRQVKLMQEYNQQLQIEVCNQKNLLSKIEKAKSDKERKALKVVLFNDMERIKQIKKALVRTQELLKPTLLTSKVNKNLRKTKQSSATEQKAQVEENKEGKQLEEQEDNEEKGKKRSLIDIDAAIHRDQLQCSNLIDTNKISMQLDNK